MQSEIRDVSVVALCRSRDEARLIKEMMMACGLINYHIRHDMRQAIDLIATTKPDAALLVEDKDLQRIKPFFEQIRSPDFEGNRFLPIIVALWSPSITEIKASIAIGAHEIISFPANTEAMSRAIYRAVFIGRPFVDVETYFGPCRRRKQIANYGSKDRRINAWDNYQHASVRSS